MFWAEDARQAGTGVRVARRLEVLAVAAKYFGRRRQAVIAKIVWRNERSTD